MTQLPCPQFVDNGNLDGMGFAPFGKVLGDGMTVVDQIYSGYGETPDQGRIQSEGNKYLKKVFPRLSCAPRFKLALPTERSLMVTHGARHKLGDVSIVKARALAVSAGNPRGGCGSSFLASGVKRQDEAGESERRRQPCYRSRTVMHGTL